LAAGLNGCATNAIGEQDKAARKARENRSEYNPRQAEMRKQKLELLMVGPDNIGLQEIIAKVGIQQEGDSDSDDAFEEKWMVPVRGLNIKAKSKMSFHPEMQMILGPTVGSGRMSDDTKQSLAEQAPYYCSNWGCVVLCYDPHDKYALDFLDDLLVIVNKAREENMKPYMPFKIIVVGINSRPLEEEFYQDQYEVADWCQRHHGNLSPHQVLLNQASHFGEIEICMRDITTLSYELREEQYQVLEMEEVFGLIDSDGGGSIDKDEFYDLLCLVGLGDSVHKEDADAMIDMVDEDGSGEVEFDEFLQVMRKRPIHGNTKEEMTKAFDDMCVGTASFELNDGNARLEQIQGWLELYKPKDATLNVYEVMEILERCESDSRPGTLNFLDFLEINS